MKITATLSKDEIIEALKNHVIRKHPEYKDAAFESRKESLKSYTFDIFMDDRSESLLKPQKTAARRPAKSSESSKVESPIPTDDN